MFQTTNQIVYGMLIVFIIPILVEIIDEDPIPKERKGWNQTLQIKENWNQALQIKENWNQTLQSLQIKENWNQTLQIKRNASR